MGAGTGDNLWSTILQAAGNTASKAADDAPRNRQIDQTQKMAVFGAMLKAQEADRDAAMQSLRMAEIRKGMALTDQRIEYWLKKTAGILTPEEELEHEKEKIEARSNARLEEYQNKLGIDNQAQLDQLNMSLGMAGNLSLPTGASLSLPGGLTLKGSPHSTAKPKTLSAEHSELKTHIYKKFPKQMADDVWGEELQSLTPLKDAEKSFNTRVNQLKTGLLSEAKPEDYAQAALDSGYSPRYHGILQHVLRGYGAQYKSGKLSMAELTEKIEAARKHFKEDLYDDTVAYYQQGMGE